ncbi:MAG: hypothetical protein A3G18_04365 [Rhodospirillales bacterium RIFCSPLOWO2_12_FULL_58_28]|nr:MAG: hypothetical protein A3H92_02535 [Rhodospirillales bacterium RIFCSPLOWO2_02_FULL_58_16]OHC77393.1 MAG: hypothetical protein A3G18_04365 [Rhodospirillales bacterium RIFCSPLOWO2_12_FULL_58_28]
MDIDVWPPDILEWRGRRLRCALGRSGVAADKREGDGATPEGSFPLRRVFYRPDRVSRPLTGLPAQEMKPTDAWCDDPDDPSYNCLVQLPFAARCEALWREDAVYDLIVELGYNDDPVSKGPGSAIFMHVAAPDYLPTAGCVALELKDLLLLLGDCDGSTRINIHSRSPKMAVPTLIKVAPKRIATSKS